MQPMTRTIAADDIIEEDGAGWGLLDLRVIRIVNLHRSKLPLRTGEGEELRCATYGSRGIDVDCEVLSRIVFG